MQEYKIAQSVHIKSLKKLFSESFSVSTEGTDCFFKNKFSLNNCSVCLIDGKIAAALHMFDTYIFKNGVIYPVYYIYAAATFPDYRRKGCMRNLVKFSHSIALKKGQLYSIVLPECDSLYDFYEKLDYKTFFKTRSVTFTFEQLKRFINGEVFVFDNSSKPDIEKIRKLAFCNDGDVFWDKSHISYTISENDVYGGVTFFTENGYAICRSDKESVDIIEIVSDKCNLKKLIFKILSNLKRERYNFRLKVDSKFFKTLGEVKKSGMISSLTGEDELGLFRENQGAYLGLALD